MLFRVWRFLLDLVGEALMRFGRRELWNFCIGIGPRKLKMNLVFSFDQGI